MKEIKRNISSMFHMILYERNLERLSLILQFLTLESLNLIKPILSSKIKDKIDNYCRSLIFYKINFIRHPVFIYNFSRMTLRVCITYRCNASCEFCYARGLFEEFPRDMSLDDFVYLIRWAKDRGWRKIMFLGGEPTIHPQFEEMLDICYKQDIFVSISSNGFFNNNILQKLRSHFVGDIAINYPSEQFSSAQRQQCFYNLEHLAKGKFFLELSAEIDGKDDSWKRVVELAIKLKASIRWSLLLPGYAKIISNQAIFSNPNLIGSQLLEILKTCAQKDVICFVYRPVPICIFTPEQWRQIRRIGRNLVYTRCLLGYKGDYTLALTVNPDLSTYPCNSFFIKGPRIISFKDRVSINEYYEKIDKDVMSIPPIEECNSCQLFRNFLSVITLSRNHLAKERLCDKNVCQAGCVDFRDYRKITSLCPRTIG